MIDVFVGINIGSISVKVVQLTEETIQPMVVNHHGQPFRILEDVLENLPSRAFFGVSGHLGHVSEVAAIERALEFFDEEFDAIASLGGEAFAVYLLQGSKIVNVLSHNRCAAGSGEFFVQQISRLGLTLADAIALAKEGKVIPLASRCSVHCKTDITHRLNRREAIREDILHTVIDSMASKVVSLLEQGKCEVRNLLVIGGVSRNEALQETLQKKIPAANIVVKPESPYFEALGTALLTRDAPQYTSPRTSVKPTFATLPFLKQFQAQVQIIKPPRVKEKERKGPFVLGVDGGSTTTKAVLLDPDDYAILASHYCRTNGDPILATKECLREIRDQIGNQDIHLIGTTGSAREIIGAFLGTAGVYNEISAHAVGAAYFDPEVDTIFEIGGQDAKYIFLRNGVPLDYAMNAACSAGTGSFFEESAHGDLGLQVTEIADIALSAAAPVQFKTDCAAFINTDIRTALQEGYSRADITAGLVYSIANNYLTKVKGARTVGQKVFLQGGVAKNRAVGYAFAQKTGKNIIIPPHPELLGAFGIALLVHEKSKGGFVPTVSITLMDLENATMKKLGEFTCRACTNYCLIDRFEVVGRKFPFGGRCSRYESHWKNTRKIDEVVDLIEERNNLVFAPLKTKSSPPQKRKGRIGIPKALSTHFLFPLYNTFFAELGFEVVLSAIDPQGELRGNAPFCFPMQIAHGAVADLEKKGIDVIFLPHLRRMPSSEYDQDSYLCPITQSTPYVISKAFEHVKFFSPMLDFVDGYDQSSVLIDLAIKKLDVSREEAIQAYQSGVQAQHATERAMQALGENALTEALGQNKLAIVLVGRSYNAFPPEASQSVARKLASKGVLTIPFDCLGKQESSSTAWYFSGLILQAVNLVKKHANLFLIYVSNFSCNIDAFTHAFLRKEMGSKPYLLLEIDSHTADAGTQTRLEAFLEIIENYRHEAPFQEKKEFHACRPVYEKKTTYIQTSSGEKISITDPRVKILFPAFSPFHSDVLAMAFRWLGLNSAEPVPLIKDQLTLGLQYTSGRECLPLPACIGQMLDAHNHRKDGEILGYYMVRGGTPCVVDAYLKFFEEFIEEYQLENLFIFDPTTANGFCGLKARDLIRYIHPTLSLADLLIEIQNSLLVIGQSGSTDALQQYWRQFLEQTTTKKKFHQNLSKLAEQIATIPRRTNPNTCPKVVVTGDFFVRFSPLFLQGLTELYSQHGILLKIVDLNELILYVLYDKFATTAEEWNVSPGSMRSVVHACTQCLAPEGKRFLGCWAGWKLLQRNEKRLRNLFQRTGLLFASTNDVATVYESASKHIHPRIFGESILTIGKGITAFSEGYDGLIAMGPLQCLPFKISEAILKPLSLQRNMPFLIYETDGYSMPPAFLRLVQVHIQQVLRRYRQELENRH